MAKKQEENNSVLCRKLKLIPVGGDEEVKRVYKYIRDGQYAQYKACNLLMGQLASEYYRALSPDGTLDNGFKQRKYEILSNTNHIISGIAVPTGLDLKSAVVKKVKKDFNTALKNGMSAGERSVTNYKRKNPLITRGRDIRLYHEYDSYMDFLDNLYSPQLKLYIKWVNNIKFEVVLGSVRSSRFLRSEIQQIMEENYKIVESSIMINEIESKGKTKKEIILNLTLKVPKQVKEGLDEKTVVGVDLGLAVPAVCGLNNDQYKRKFIGTEEELLHNRVAIQKQRRSLNRSLRNTKGGHGRTRKLSALERLKDRETNYVTTYNHMISRRVVEFALENNAKYINLENLKGIDTKEYILRNWSYYQLQKFIEDKAKRHGIEVRKIKPAYTSQTCSCCGHYEEGQRITQSQFVCKNCGQELNADFNASRNIAMSENFVTEEEQKQQKKRTKKTA